MGTSAVLVGFAILLYFKGNKKPTAKPVNVHHSPRKDSEVEVKGTKDVFQIDIKDQELNMKDIFE